MFNRNWTVRVAAAWMLGYLLVPAATAQQVSELYHVRDAVSQSYVEYHQVTVPKGKEVVLADLKGPGKVTYFYVTPISDMVLKIFWDDETEPSVQAPLARLFWRPAGQDHRLPVAAHANRASAVTCVICRCRFPSVRGSFWPTTATKTTPPAMAYGIDYEQDQQYAGEKSRLHCMWRRSNPVLGRRTAAGPRDQAFAMRREEQHQHATHDLGGERPRPLCGRFPPGLYQESRLVGRGHHDLPRGRQDHGPLAGNRG